MFTELPVHIHRFVQNDEHGSIHASDSSCYGLLLGRFYLPEELHCGKLPSHLEREVFDSNVSDENEIATVRRVRRQFPWRHVHHILLKSQVFTKNDRILCPADTADDLGRGWLSLSDFSCMRLVGLLAFS